MKFFELWTLDDVDDTDNDDGNVKVRHSSECGNYKIYMNIIVKNKDEVHVKINNQNYV